MTYSPEMIEAFVATIAAYDEAISGLTDGTMTLEQFRVEWHKYGYTNTCRLCQVCDSKCEFCVLHDPSFVFVPCGSGRTLQDLMLAVIYPYKPLPALIARRKFLIDRAASNGVDLG